MENKAASIENRFTPAFDITEKNPKRKVILV